MMLPSFGNSVGCLPQVVLKADVERNELLLKERELLAKQDVCPTPTLPLN
jgi:hypothetical protein